MVWASNVSQVDECQLRVCDGRCHCLFLVLLCHSSTLSGPQLYSTGGVILYSVFAALLLYLLFESVWSNVLALMLKKRSSVASDRKVEDQSKPSETTNGRTGRTNETDFTINRHLVTNGANKWSTNGYRKDMNGNLDEYRVVSMSTTAGSVYSDVAQVGHKTRDRGHLSLDDKHDFSNTKL